MTAVGVCAAFHTAARVDAAPFSAVGVGVMLPILLRLVYVRSFILLLGWMLPLLMRLVWTLQGGDTEHSLAGLPIMLVIGDYSL